MVYDVSNQESFDHVQDWLQEVNRYASDGTCKLLIGNKNDRPDKVVNTAMGQTMGDELNISFLETSAKTADNVEAAFMRMAQQLIKTRCVPLACVHIFVGANLILCVCYRDARGATAAPATETVLTGANASEKRGCCK